MRKTIFFFATCLIFIQFAMGQNINFTPVQWSTGYSSPIALVPAPGENRLFVVEQAGRIWIVDMNGVKSTTPFLDISNLVDQSGGERGLLGLAFHPGYDTNGYFYLNYTRGNTHIARFSRINGNPDKADSLSEVGIMEIYQPYTNHNGGELVFGPDGYLYIGTGDGGDAGDPQNRAQDPDSLLGKMLRIDVDNGSPYAIPPSNPYLGNADTLPEIWALGMRNPWKYSFDRLTGDLWIADVGQYQREEVNYVPAGYAGKLNFGWRCREGLSNFTACGSTMPFYDPHIVYTHSGGKCSVTGGYVYRGTDIPGLTGKYIYGDYCSGEIFVSDTAGIVLESYETPEFISAFGQDSSGEIYMAGHITGRIYKLINTLGTEDYNTSVQVFPNPATDVLQVTGITGSFTFDLIDLQGRICISGTVAEGGSVPVQTLKTGVYQLRISQNGNTWHKRVVKA